MEKSSQSSPGLVPFPALYQKDFRYLWLGQAISFSGTWMHSTAQGWLIYSLTHSPLYLGVVAAFSSMPVLFFSLLGGVAADRFRKRNLIMATQALSMLPAIAIGVLTQLGIITVWEVIPLVFFLGMVNSFDVPARQSYFAEIVEKDNLVGAIALNSAAVNGARIIGPVLAGMVIAYAGLPACFYLNAASFLAVILALARIRAKSAVVPREHESIKKDLLEGMSFVRQNPFIFAVFIIIGAFSLFAIPFINLLPVFAVEVFKRGPKGLGFLAGATGLGAFTGAVTLAYKGGTGRVGRARRMRIGAVLLPIALIAFSESRNFYLSMAILAVAGWSLISFLSLANSSVQLAVSDALRGRVMSVYTIVFLGFAPIGNLILGAASDMAGTTRALAASSSVCLAIVLAFSHRLHARYEGAAA
ncbi:MAG: MFS transporter [Nitrospiraceae bacterium]|nr:MFS transporter [Nitrospiraceae bacterium]